MMKIIQIVTALPPEISGVGDYALFLARQLRADHDIHSVFVDCSENWKPIEGTWQQAVDIHNSELIDGFPIHRLHERSAAEMLRVLSRPGMPATVLLHYVGYGYEKRGCPAWLLNAVRKWKTPESTFLTMFHELFAFGPPWGSAFWTSPLQRWLTKCLARLSSHCFTNMNTRARILKKFTSRNDSDFTVMPVFSNMGEPGRLPAWCERQPRMIVFGSVGWRRKVYFECKSSLETACRAMGIDEIVDIGCAMDIPQLAVPVSCRGILSAAEGSHEMLNSRAGFFAYPINTLGKSGIFSAYAAHGLVPVTYNENKVENEDGLLANKHFIFSNPVQRTNAEEVGRQAREWYDNHSLKRQAALFFETIKNQQIQ